MIGPSNGREPRLPGSAEKQYHHDMDRDRTICELRLPGGGVFHGYSSPGTGYDREAGMEAESDAVARWRSSLPVYEQAEQKSALGEVVSMAKAAGDAAYQSPEQILEEARAEFQEGGEWHGRRKALVVSLDKSEGRFKVNYLNADMSCSEMIAVAEVLKAMAINDMGYTVSPDEVQTIE